MIQFHSAAVFRGLCWQTWAQIGNTAAPLHIHLSANIMILKWLVSSTTTTEAQNVRLNRLSIKRMSDIGGTLAYG